MELLPLLQLVMLNETTWTFFFRYKDRTNETPGLKLSWRRLPHPTLPLDSHPNSANVAIRTDGASQ
jgi:hypothetical protein